jgi:hypothetical protein
MGARLGKIYYQLFNECASLHVKWHEFVTLYGTTEDEVTLLNSAAPRFFPMVEDVLWEDIVLHIARLLDRNRGTLSLERLPKLVASEIQIETQAAVAHLREQAQFAIAWRNNHIGHRNLESAIGPADAQVVPAVSLAEVDAAIGGVDAVLNILEEHYCQSAPIAYSYVSADGALLLKVLRAGVTAREERLSDLRRGARPR